MAAQMTADPLKDWRVQPFKAETEAALRTNAGRLRSTIMAGGGYELAHGKMQAIKHFYGPRRPMKAGRRHQDTVYQENSFTRRHVVGETYDDANLFDRLDDLVIDQNLMSPVRDSMIHGFQLEEDVSIIKGMLGVARVGETGEKNVKFDPNNVIPADVGGAGSGLNHEKLLRFRKNIQNKKVALSDPMNQLHVLAAPGDEEALLQFNLTLSADFHKSGASPVQTGELPPLYKLNFHFYEDDFFEECGLLDRANNKRTLVAWAKSGVYMGLWQDLFVDLDKAIDKKHNLSLFMQKTWGVTRTYEEKVWKIEVNDNTLGG